MRHLLALSERALSAVVSAQAYDAYSNEVCHSSIYGNEGQSSLCLHVNAVIKIDDVVKAMQYNS
eukprot:2201672-Pleurochrysis_carterae.AAC.1